MNEQPTEAQKKSRLRWVTLGEAVAIAALIVSAGGLWLTWKTSDKDHGPAEVVERTADFASALHRAIRTVMGMWFTCVSPHCSA